ncbi:alpha/beta hydrolase [Kitasatospora sp. NPDC057965]|uniref:alpha/beta hydrolase n=1 Tax=Kitasatospora sp. NPDC057965 TaxID=3346291 RepID=UPI0036DDDFEB
MERAEQGRAREAPNTLRKDMLTLAPQPMPPMGGPRPLRWLPQLAVAALAVFAAVSATEDILLRPVGVIHAALLLPALFRPLPAWWLSLVLLPVLSLDPAFRPYTGWAWAVHTGLLFLVALRNPPRVMAATVLLSAALLLGLQAAGDGIGPWYFTVIVLLMLAKTPGKRTPAVVLAHAGGFHTFDKSDLRGTGRWLADHGVAVFAVDYRLAAPDRPTWDKAPQDLVSALSWVQRNADTYGIDGSRISLGGMSAGGTLAMNTAYRLQNGTIKAAEGATPTPPASVIGFYPGTDVAGMWEEDVAGTREAAEMFTGGTPQQYPDRYREVSPTSDIRAGLPRTLLVVGDRDRSARPGTVTAFGDALKEQGVRTEVRELPFAEHAFDDAYGSLTSQTSRQILLDFLLEDAR